MSVRSKCAVQCAVQRAVQCAVQCDVRANLVSKEMKIADILQAF